MLFHTFVKKSMNNFHNRKFIIEHEYELWSRSLVMLVHALNQILHLWSWWPITTAIFYKTAHFSISHDDSGNGWVRYWIPGADTRKWVDRKYLNWPFVKTNISWPITVPYKFVIWLKYKICTWPFFGPYWENAMPEQFEIVKCLLFEIILNSHTVRRPSMNTS